MRTLYPETEPYDQGMLDVGDGQRIHWERVGSPHGKPAVFLHGGPGGGLIPDHRRVFDPAAYDVLLFDQRGCGQSTPNAGEHGADLTHNTTWDLVADIERLREMVDVERWQVFGGSWGSTLGLAYAETHPDRVTELILRGIFTVRARELAWAYAGGSAQLFPDRWEDFIAPIPQDERGDLLHAYHRRLFDPDPEIRQRSAVAWSVWEAALLHLIPRQEPIDAFSQPEIALAFARIETHYFVNGAFMDDGQLLRDAARLRDIPGVIVQGRYDICTPPVTAWELHRGWPTAEFILVPDAGHSAAEPGIAHHLVEATDRFATRSASSSDPSETRKDGLV
jgi:proline iminopeptidase